MCLLLLALVVFCGPGVQSSEFRLSDSKILLPYHSFAPLNYTLYGSNGTCYEWHSGTSEVATVTPLFRSSPSSSHCSTEAVVTAVWQSPHRAVTTIYGKVAATGHVMKCDVIVDNIQRIEIGTTTQELYLHNTPESLTVVAYDEYGNTFSTLDGVPFEWRIQGDSYGGVVDGHGVLRFLTWAESEYTAPQSIANLESKGLQGHIQLVGGLVTGSAVVSVSLREPVYSTVPPAQVRLLVMANAQLSPALAYLLPESRLQLHVRVVQQGSDRMIRLPSPQYHLQVNDTNVVDLDPHDASTVTAKQYGHTDIKLLDRNVEEALENLQKAIHDHTVNDDDLRLPRRQLPTSLIHVVEPAYLGFTMQAVQIDDTSNFCQKAIIAATHQPPMSSFAVRSWVMEVGRQYTIQIDIYDQNSHRLYPTDNVRLEVNVPDMHFHLLNSTENVTFLLLQPIAPGIVSLKAKLTGVVNKDGAVILTKTSVVGVQELTIYPPVLVFPLTVLLPGTARTTDSHTDLFRLKATGGSGQYNWIALPGRTNETAAVSVNHEGDVSVVQAFGDAVVVASSPSNPQLCGSARVIVSSPAVLKFVPGPSEVMVPSPHRTTHSAVGYQRIGDHSDDSSDDRSVLTVGLAVLDVQGRSLTDCRALDILFRPLDDSVIKVLPGRSLHPARMVCYHCKFEMNEDY
ncbi:hypothetical protein PHET_09911 [Paragonimus heterotremus]|uniref:BIG2 domain-containing protein n=1 Tax=Paragonimus heterotremus TaxID=100268 RepID=A0A8J4T0P4_9TREM|nr:hypothetical protein PHET_09911 [Paragonimus heterotremus]